MALGVKHTTALSSTFVFVLQGKHLRTVGQMTLCWGKNGAVMVQEAAVMGQERNAQHDLEPRTQRRGNDQRKVVSQVSFILLISF